MSNRIPAASLRCKPRDTRYLLDKHGLEWRTLLPTGTWWGVAFGGRCYYWVPPKKASRPFERTLGSLDLEIKGALQ